MAQIGAPGVGSGVDADTMSLGWGGVRSGSFKLQVSPYPTHDERCDRLIIVQERCALNELLRETVGMIDCVSRLV